MDPVSDGRLARETAAFKPVTRDEVVCNECVAATGTGGRAVTDVRDESADAGARARTGLTERAQAALTEETAVAHVHGICLKTGPPGRVGVELEWLVRDARDPVVQVAPERVAAAVTAFAASDQAADLELAPRSVRNDLSFLPLSLSSGALLTAEPGGQLELSSAPADTLGDCVDATARDLTALREAMSAAGLELAGYGFDPLRPPKRQLDLPRYAAMEEFFDRTGPWGREMMCSTASVQVCLDAGDDSPAQSGYRQRWRLVHAIGPVLVAAFANSPLRRGKPSGWRSTRQEVWGRLDPGRTRAPEDGTGDPRDAWAKYALDAELMCVRREGSPDWSAPAGVTFRDWVADGDAAGRRPCTEDLTYHLSTLFPPVRPRGHLELRMIDAQGGDGWIVPAAVATALVDDPVAADAAMAATEEVGGDGEDPWLRAARCGPEDPSLARASRKCFEAADAALSRSGAPAAIRRAVAAFTERYVLRNRCPADDHLEEAR